jgi:hypothetical protein
MANDLAKNPMVLDTVGAQLTGKNISINSVQWCDPTTVGHTVLLLDQNGNIILKGTCVTASQSLIKYFKPGFTFQGLNLSAIGSGEVHVLYNSIDDAGARVKPFRE